MFAVMVIDANRCTLFFLSTTFYQAKVVIARRHDEAICPVLAVVVK